tara:strand:+ start:83 stop:832 length:750 start_codon:yes stop_codon:yes gene_type:complete
MAGHSKFKNIMHRKGAQDKKRAKIFSRLGKEISVSVKAGGPDPETNIRLRTAISSAKSLNMPKENIDRAIKKGAGNDLDSNFEEVRYEGYGPDGIALIVEAMTNNKNRTASEIRSTFSKYGGNLGETGSVSYNFKKVGMIALDKKLAVENELFDFIVDNGSNDLEINEDEYQIYCDQDNLITLNEKISKKFGATSSSQLIWKSENNIDIKRESAEKLFKLINTLEDNDDVQSVSSNFEVSDEVLKILTQ